jgi:hypothetical protein
MLTETTSETADGTNWEYTERVYRYDPAFGDFESVSSSIQALTSPDDDAIIFGTVGNNC